jgi:hypothetical protein
MINPHVRCAGKMHRLFNVEPRGIINSLPKWVTVTGETVLL